MQSSTRQLPDLSLRRTGSGPYSGPSGIVAGQRPDVAAVTLAGAAGMEGSRKGRFLAFLTCGRLLAAATRRHLAASMGIGDGGPR
jgi:hypothetical protein